VGGRQFAIGEASEDQVALRLAEPAQVYEHPEASASIEETLPAGTVVIARRRSGDFVEVVTPSENFGFILASAVVEQIGASPEVAGVAFERPAKAAESAMAAQRSAVGAAGVSSFAADDDFQLAEMPTERVHIYDRIDSNKRRTVLLLFGWVVFVSLLVAAVAAVVTWYAGQDPVENPGLALQIAGFAALISLGVAIFMYFTATSTVLAISGGHEVTKEEEPLLYRIVENLSIGSGLPMPKVYVVEDSAPNAFATGRDPEHAVVAATRGLLAKLEKREVEAVMAHEMSHVGNYDIRLMTIVAVAVGLVALLADVMLRFTWYGSGGRSSNKGKGGGAAGAIILVLALLFIVLSPIIASAMRFALSRQREYLADSSGALLSRNPDALADALEKISRDPDPLETANKATAHLYIENPLKEHSSFMNNFFATHPPVEDRIRILRAMG
jgi:heat shock protein HtpX